MLHTIYVLRDPLSGQDRYVGSTRFSPHERLAAHLSETRIKSFSHSPKQVWIRNLAARGLEPIIAIIDEAPDRLTAIAIESWWLKWKRQQGDDLLNWDN